MNGYGRTVSFMAEWKLLSSLLPNLPTWNVKDAYIEVASFFLRAATWTTEARDSEIYWSQRSNI